MLQQRLEQIYECQVKQTQQKDVSKCTVIIRKKDLNDQIIDKQTLLISKLKKDNTSLKRIIQIKNTEITKLKLSIDQLQLANIQMNQRYLTLEKESPTVSFLQEQNLILKQKIKNYEDQLTYSFEKQQRELNKLYAEIQQLQNQNISLRQLNNNLEREQIPRQLQQLQKKCKDLQKELAVQRRVNQTLFKQAQSKSTASYLLKESQTPAICIEEEPNEAKEVHDLQHTRKASKNFTIQTKTLLHQSCYSVESIQNNDKSITYQKSEAQIQTQKYEIYQPVISRERLQKSLSSRRNNHMKSVDENTRLLTLSRQLNEKEEQIRQLYKKMEKQKKNSESVKSKLKKKEKQLKMMKKNSIQKQIMVVDDANKIKDEDGDNRDDTSPIQILEAESKIEHRVNDDVQQQHCKVQVEQFQAQGQQNGEYVIEIREESRLTDVIMQTEPLKSEPRYSELQSKPSVEHLRGPQIKKNELQVDKIDNQSNQDIQQIVHDYMAELVQKCVNMQQKQQQRQPNRQVQIQEQLQSSKQEINVLRSQNDRLRRLLEQTEDLLQNEQRRNSQKGSATPVVAEDYQAEQMKINLMIMHDEDSQNGGSQQLIALRKEVESLRGQLISNTEDAVQLLEVVTQTDNLDVRDVQTQIVFPSTNQAITQADEVVEDLEQKQKQKQQYQKKLQAKYKQVEQKQQIIRQMTQTIVQLKNHNQQLRNRLTINQQLLNQQRQQAEKDKIDLQWTHQQGLYKQGISKDEVIQLAEAQIYAITLTDKIAQKIASQDKSSVEVEAANIAEESFLPERVPAFGLNSQEDNLFQSNFSLGNLDSQFHLKYQKLVKQMQGLREENKYLHEMVSLMKSIEEDRSSEENRDMVVSFNIKQSKILSLQQLQGSVLKSSALYLGSEKVRSSQHVESLIKVPQVRQNKEHAEMPRSENVYDSLQSSIIRSPDFEREKVQRMTQELEIKEQQIKLISKELQRVQSKLLKSKKSSKKNREERGVNQEIEIQEEQVILAEVQTQTHPQMLDSGSIPQNLQDFCDELQYRLQLQNSKNASLKQKIKKYRAELKKLQQEQTVLVSDNIEEIEIEEQAVQMCEVQMQTDFNNSEVQKPSHQTVRQKMKKTGQMFLNVIENLQQKCIDQDSEEIQSQNFQNLGKLTAKSVALSQQAKFKADLGSLWNQINSVFQKHNFIATRQLQIETFPEQLQLFIQFIKAHQQFVPQETPNVMQATPFVSSQAKNQIIDNKQIEVSHLQLLFIENQKICQRQHFPSLNPLLITQVAYSADQSQAFIEAVVKLARLTVSQINFLLNTLSAKLSELQTTLEGEQLQQKTLQQIVRLFGVQNVTRVVEKIEN